MRRNTPRRQEGISGHGCLHQFLVTGLLQCDLLHIDDPSLVYSTGLRVSICKDCGHMELHCQSHHDVCQWLGNTVVSTRKPLAQ